MTEDEKRKIDDMSYEDMLDFWRFAPVGNKIFQGDTGDYYSKVMKEKEDKITHIERVCISKKIGW